MKMHARNNVRKSLRAALAALLLAAVAIPVFGTVVPKMELSELVRGSDKILQGRVEAIEVRLDEKLNLPFTWVRLHVDDPIKGVSESTVVMKHVGGKAPGSPYTITVNGMPQFNQGDNVIVFLKTINDGSNTYQVVGLNQGKYEVINEVAISQISGVELMDPRTGKPLPTGYTERAPLDAFKARIRGLVR